MSLAPDDPQGLPSVGGAHVRPGTPATEEYTPDIGTSGAPTSPLPGDGPTPVGGRPAAGNHRDPQGLSLGELFAEVSRDLTTLLRQEVDLAKAEAMESAKRAGRGTGMLGGAAYAGGMTLLFLSIALWWALGNATGYGWSALIVAALWAVVAAVMASVGRKELRRAPGMPETADSLKKIPSALSGNDSGGMRGTDVRGKETNR